ncbi:Retrovirus-related Pol polyprotein from transposon TNT 1-94 [Dendrobium catenatum]|uniref:Retrovirus-related Pol polyprotein from transposon TNT 1-94 n=1 Tax=Dendrobium catenatum TaxID=906689 RepID=A0A2I0XHH4_9ASPA|nr:Retrovirus-related Pol polyprotein from transposon TNT 1-94 [Dendrobium catenatum]
MKDKCSQAKYHRLFDPPLNVPLVRFAASSATRLSTAGTDATSITHHRRIRGRSRHNNNKSIRMTGSWTRVPPPTSPQMPQIFSIRSLTPAMTRYPSPMEAIFPFRTRVKASCRYPSTLSLQDNQVLLRGPKRNGLYHIRLPTKHHEAALASTMRPKNLWHERLGHPHSRKISILAKSIAAVENFSTNTTCISCNTSKMHKQPFPVSNSICNKPFQIIHSDIWGPAPCLSKFGYRYYVTFIDDCTRFTWLFLLKSKDEVFSKFQFFCNLINNQFKTKILILRSDGGGEYTSHSFRNYLAANGITHQMSCPHTPEQNGIAERKHRHIIEMTRTLLHSANLPLSFWAEATTTAVYLINRLPSSVIQNQTPYHKLNGSPASYAHLRIFGFLCFPWTKPYAPNKLSPRSQECVFIGYSAAHKGYNCYNILQDRVYTSRNVIFFENQFPYKTTQITLDTPTTNNPEYLSPLLLVPSSTVQHRPQSSSHLPTASPQRASRVSSAPTHEITHPTQLPSTEPICHPMQTRLRSGISKPRQILDLSATTIKTKTPTSYAEASKHAEWRSAMSAEFLALIKQGTWLLVPPPADKPILGSKWTFKTKLYPNGQVERYKARLVAQGCAQEFGINFTETFSPVAKMVTIRMLITVALNRNWKVTQLDVSNAFLHGELEDEVYMKQPRGFEDAQHPTHVCKLRKSIYGLKQSPRQWFHKLTRFLLQLGFSFSKADPSLLQLKHHDTTVFILIYVDDILVTGNDQELIQHILQRLNSVFSLKQSGDISLYLGIQVIKTNFGYFLSQSHYAHELVRNAGNQGT